MLAGAMMLEFLGEGDAAWAIERAVRCVLAEGKTVTADLGGAATTDEVATAVLREVDVLQG
jgi:isocitrate/isopropylmalate dehydrogenase